MQIVPIPTPILQPGDDLATFLSKEDFTDGDIIVISSKAIATAEGAAIDLSKITPTKEAEEWAKKSGRTAAFRQAVLDETLRMHGKVVSSTSELMMTELKPDGLGEGSLLVPNAGLDESNVQERYAIGWPLDPLKSVKHLKKSLEKNTGKKLAVIISDSCSRPRRLGVTALALTVSGIDPFRNLIGNEDLFGKTLKMTQEAIADQLATAANFLMGNSAESIPAAVIRDHGIELTEFEGWVPGIEPEKDMFGGMGVRR